MKTQDRILIEIGVLFFPFNLISKLVGVQEFHQREQFLHVILKRRSGENNLVIHGQFCKGVERLGGIVL